MKQKIGTILDQRLLRRVKVYAAQRGQPVSAVFEDAIRALLDQAEVKAARPSVVAATAGSMAIDRTVLAAILAEDVYDAS